MTEQNRWEGLFDEFLDVIEFRLVRYPTGWGVVDCQGANLGDIERDRFENAKSLIDRLDVYIQDYFIADIAEDAECDSYNGWEELLTFARTNMAEEDQERYCFELDVLEMLCRHPDEINLANCQFTEEAD